MRRNRSNIELDEISLLPNARSSKRQRDDEFTDLQFQAPPGRFPVKAIALAVGLFLAGSLLIIIGALLLAGYISVQYADRTWPVIILGSIMFIPGFYHVRIAYYAYRGYDGYSFDDIPEFED